MMDHFDKIRKRKVLITVGLGFIEQNLAKMLVEQYYCAVVLVDNYLNSTQEVIRGLRGKIRFHNISILDKERFLQSILRILATVGS